MDEHRLMSFHHQRPLNLDVNDGNPIGIGICVSTGYRGRRSTAADLISNPPDNLTVIINTPVDQVLFDGKTAIGVKSGEQKCKLSTYSPSSFYIQFY